MIKQIVAKDKRKPKDKWEGIRGIYEDSGELAKGGKVIHQVMYWNAPEEIIQKELKKYIEDFPNFEFKIIERN